MLSLTGALTGGSGSSVRYDPLRGLVLRVLRGADEGRDVLYPEINFCKTPEAICAAQEGPIKRVVDLFEVRTHQAVGCHSG